MWKIVLGTGLLVGIGAFVWYVTQPVPGQAMAEQGREHVDPQEVVKFHYNSNPPTSGPHVPTWVKPGIYAEPQQEGELIHSLEHGYIVIHYNCRAKTQISTSSGESTSSAVLNTPACKMLVQQLSDLARKKRIWKLVVVPRPQLDTAIAVTAWGHIDKLNEFDSKRITAFIDYYRDHGPEKTME